MSFLSYNIAGLKSKVKSALFLNFVMQFDIFVLLETFVMSDDAKLFCDYFGDYRLCWVSASKTSRMGRACGGKLLGIRSSLSEDLFSFANIVGVDLILIKHSGVRVALLPIYLNCNNWEADFGGLCDFLQKVPDMELVLAGDFNVRIAESQVFPDEVVLDNPRCNLHRVSKDKVLNSNGSRLLELCDDRGLIILNGRFEGDGCGEFTFIGARGASVNDLVCISLPSLRRVTSFEVGVQTFSDHLPLCFSLDILSGVGGSRVGSPLLPQLRWDHNFLEHYRGRVGEAVRELPCVSDPQRYVEKLCQCISASSPRSASSSVIKSVQKSPWFDYKCWHMRKRCFALLNLFRRTGASMARMAYIEANRSYSSACAEAKLRYFNHLHTILCNLKDSKQFWNVVNSFRISHSVSGNINRESVLAHFRSLFNDCSPSPTLFAAPHYVSDILDSSFSMDELAQVVSSLKDNKASGPDRITYEFYKYAPQVLLDKLLSLFNFIYSSGDIPPSFAQSIIFLLYKGGDRDQISNYRGISCMNTVAKIFCSLLLRRLEHFVDENNILSESQSGFRKGYSVIDNVFVLSNIVNIKLSHPGNKIYCFFIDLKSAFDRVDHSLLFVKLYDLGVSEKFMRTLKCFYSHATSMIRDSHGVSDFFRVSSGVRQGCVLSPLLFSLFVNDLPTVLEGGVRIGNERIKILMYADDMVLIADNPVALQWNINLLDGYCSRWNLSLNLGKSKIMVFRRGGRLVSSEKWMYRHSPIEVVSRYKYLGVILTPRLSFIPHLASKIVSAKLGINKVWLNFFSQDGVPFEAKIRVYKSISRAIVCFASQVWGYSRYEDLEKFQRFFAKKLFSLPFCSPNYFVDLEVGLAPLECVTLEYQVKYCLKVLQMPHYRLPRIVALEVIQSRVAWFKRWISLARSLSCPFDSSLEFSPRWGGQLFAMISRLESSRRSEALASASQSNRFLLYRVLVTEYNSYGINVFSEGLSFRDLRWLVKLRGELLWLNHKPWLEEESSRGLCCLCNSVEPEDLFHFLGVCSSLSEIRRLHLGSSWISREVIMEYLSGQRSCLPLVNFSSHAWKFRYEYSL